MKITLNPLLVPKRGRKLIVLLICRISKKSQDEKSLADQEALYRGWLQAHTDCEVEIVVIAGQGGGERLTRKEHEQACDEVESGRFDLVLVEDLGRICRRVHAFLFAEACEDQKTRLIAINDHVDTATEGWRLNSFFAVMRHEIYNADTSKRIRRTLRNRFMQGGIVQFVIAGIIKPEGTKSDSDLRKDPAFEAVYDKVFQLLEDGASFAEVADWLNKNNVPVGPYARKKEWGGPMLAKVVRNPLLKGTRVRNKKVSKRNNKTGDRRSVEAPPEELLERNCPHLAFIEPERYDRVLRKVNARSKKFGRKKRNGVDSRQGTVWKQTNWPGQHLGCDICKRKYYWSGVEGRRCLMCSGAYHYRCWNSLTLEGESTVRRLTQAIWQKIRELPDFDSEFIATLRQSLGEETSRSQSRQKELDRQRDAVQRQIERVTEAIADIGNSPSLKDKLKSLENQLEETEVALSELREGQRDQIELPSLDDIRAAAEELFTTFVPEDQEAARLLRRLIPKMVVTPVRLCDDGAVVARVKLTLNLAALSTSGLAAAELGEAMTCELTVDLFDDPQRAAYRERVMALRAAGLTQRQVADHLGLTQPAVQNAIALDRRMKELGLIDPYVPVLEPPSDYTKLRRHRHPRYRFEPLTDESVSPPSASSEPPTVSFEPTTDESVAPPDTDAEAA